MDRLARLFRGRLSRRNFIKGWVVVLLAVLVVLPVVFASTLAAINNGGSMLWLVLPIGLYTISFVLLLGMTSRRLHDAGFGGALLALFFVGLGWVLLLVMSFPRSKDANKWGMPNTGSLPLQAILFG
jgi:uncharacterized membrane protein YhaH (DUF805 family)